MATRKRTKKPSKAARKVAELMLTPPPEFQAVLTQLQRQTQQLDAMDSVLKQLYTVVTGKPFPTNVLTEPAPLPTNVTVLNG